MHPALDFTADLTRLVASARGAGATDLLDILRTETLASGGIWAVPERLDPRQPGVCLITCHTITGSGFAADDAARDWLRSARAHLKSANGQRTGPSPTAAALREELVCQAVARGQSLPRVTAQAIEDLAGQLASADAAATADLLRVIGQRLEAPNTFKKALEITIARIEAAALPQEAHI